MSIASRRAPTRPVEWGLTVAHDGPVVRLIVRGEIDMASVGELQRVLTHTLLDGVSTFAVDLTDVDFIESAGMAWLLRANQHVTAAGATMVVLVAEGPVYRAIQLAGLGERLIVRSDRSPPADKRGVNRGRTGK